MKVSEIEIGKIYNNLLVIRRDKNRNRSAYFTCQCTKCGKTFSIRADHIGKAKSCRQCFRESRIIDLAGMKFGRLIPIEFVGRKNGRTLWRCKCDCGNYTIAGYSNLVNGITRSCGCYDREMTLERNRNRRQSTISHSFLDDNIRNHPLYGLWASMITRCKNKNRSSAKYYCNKGVEVCDRWSGIGGFENFVSDMGPRPSQEHTLDRIDNNGNYEPNNCRWADVETQMLNRSNTKYVFVDGNKIPLKVLCKNLGLNYYKIIKQIGRGFDLQYIVNHPFCDFRDKEHSNAPRNYNIHITINTKNN